MMVKPPKLETLQEIVFVCSEYRGISKAGGISVMVADLSEKLALLGEKVLIVTPWYDNLDPEKSDFLKNAERLDDITISTDKDITFEIYRSRKFLIKKSGSSRGTDASYNPKVKNFLDFHFFNWLQGRGFEQKHTQHIILEEVRTSCRRLPVQKQRSLSIFVSRVDH